jgi:hypothetical protein
MKFVYDSVGNPHGKNYLVDRNIKMDLRDIGCEIWNGLHWLRILKNDGALLLATFNRICVAWVNSPFVPFLVLWISELCM